MKITKHLGIVLLFISLFTSCIPSEELESIKPLSVRVNQGASSLKDQVSMIDYGTLRVAKDSLSKSYVLTNNGNTTLRFSEISSDNGDFFVELEKDTTALLPQQSLPFTVTFAPRLGGQTIGKISFATNDPAYPVFSFGVQGFAVDVPEIIGNNSPQFEELNDVVLGAGQPNGTRFTMELYIEDPYNRIDPNTLSLQLNAKFSNGDEATIVKPSSDITVSEDRKRITYSFVVRFNESVYVDVESILILANGDVSEVFTTRIEKPQGAN